jgi:hypothetical protein
MLNKEGQIMSSLNGIDPTNGKPLPTQADIKAALESLGHAQREKTPDSNIELRKKIEDLVVDTSLHPVDVSLRIMALIEQAKQEARIVPVVCTVCKGVGTMPATFYPAVSSTGTNFGNVTCKTCKGVTILTPDRIAQPSNYKKENKT